MKRNGLIKKIIHYIYLPIQLMQLKMHKKVIVLFGTEDLGNYGDQHIALSELEFLHYYFKDYYIMEVPATSVLRRKSLLNYKFDHNVILFSQGGGNLGDQYLLGERMRHLAISLHPENQYFIFPQTVYYKDEDGEWMRKDKIAFNGNAKVHLFIREQISYELAKKYFQCDIRLFPDMVLFSQYGGDKYHRSGVMICLRSDAEKRLTNQEHLNITSVAEKIVGKVKISDTQVERNIPISRRKEELKKKVKEFKSSELVITDRLHGMVFSAITSTPCVVFKNYNHKVEGVYQWISELGYIQLIDSVEDLESAIHMVMEKKSVYHKSEMLKREFDTMAEYIRSNMQKEE